LSGPEPVRDATEAGRNGNGGAASLRPEERKAANLLQALLFKAGHRSASWKPGDNPPDLEFNVDGGRWAVEVTRIDQQVGLGNSSKSRYDFERKHASLGQKIAKRVKPLATQNYVLAMPNCPPGADWNKWQRKLTSDIVRHMERGGGELVLDRQTGAGLSVHGLGNDVWVIVVPPRWMPSGQAAADISASQAIAIKHAFVQKSPKLARLTGYQVTALILINGYVFFDQDRGHADALAIARQFLPRFPAIGQVYFAIGSDLRRIA
jgi:hypothetical protein